MAETWQDLKKSGQLQKLKQIKTKNKQKKKKKKEEAVSKLSFLVSCPCVLLPLVVLMEPQKSKKVLENQLVLRQSCWATMCVKKSFLSDFLLAVEVFLNTFVQQLGKVIGKGGFGVVYKAVNIKTGEFVAIKQIKASAASSDRSSVTVCFLLLAFLQGLLACFELFVVSKYASAFNQLIQQEMEILSSLSHPNIVKVIETLENEGSFSLVLEFAYRLILDTYLNNRFVDSGSLAGIVEKFGPCPESLAAVYVDQALYLFVFFFSFEF